RVEVLEVVLRHHVEVRLVARALDRRLVLLGQLVPLLGVHVERVHRVALPPPGEVVVGRDLVETELLVVVRTDPFGRVDRAALEGGIDVAARDLLRHRAQARHHLAAQAGDADLHALEVADGVHLLAPPAAHLYAGVARRERDDAELAEEIAHLLEPSAVVDPGVLLPLVHAEGQRRVEGERLVLAHEVVARGVRALDRVLLDRIHHAEGRDDLARGEDADLELARGELGDALRYHFPAAEDRVEAFREARCAAPADVRKRFVLRDGLRHRGRAARGDGAAREELATIHRYVLLFMLAGAFTGTALV